MPLRRCHRFTLPVAADRPGQASASAAQRRRCTMGPQPGPRKKEDYRGRGKKEDYQGRGSHRPRLLRRGCGPPRSRAGSQAIYFIPGSVDMRQQEATLLEIGSSQGAASMCCDAAYVTSNNYVTLFISFFNTVELARMCNDCAVKIS